MTANATLPTAAQPAASPTRVSRQPIVETDDTPEPLSVVATVAPTTTPAVTTETNTLPTPSVATPTIETEATQPAPGAAERPVQLIFPPVAPAVVIMQRAEPLAEALRAATGVEFAVGIADSEEALVGLLCSAPADVIAFISAAAYTIAHEQCDAGAGLVAVQEDGLTWQTGMIVTGPDDVAELADLDGQRWAVADTRSLPNYLYFRAQMAEAEIEPSEIVTAAEESSALLALRDGAADFTTAGFVPPIMPVGRVWTYGETAPEVWRSLGVPPTRSPIGYVIVAWEPELGGYRLRDARARLFDTTPDIFDVTRILALSEPIPNETVVLGADLPLDLAEQTLAAMTEFAASGACRESLCSADFFGWTGLEPANDAAYDPIRYIRDTLELEDADLWAELD